MARNRHRSRAFKFDWRADRFAQRGNHDANDLREKTAMKLFASSGHKFGQLSPHAAPMAFSKSPIRSRHRCPQCDSPLFYVNTAFTFLTGRKRRVCLAANCSFEEQRRFRIITR